MVFFLFFFITFPISRKPEHHSHITKTLQLQTVHAAAQQIHVYVDKGQLIASGNRHRNTCLLHHRSCFLSGWSQISRSDWPVLAATVIGFMLNVWTIKIKLVFQILKPLLKCVIENKIYNEQVSDLGLFSLEKRRLKWDPTALYSSLKENCCKEGIGLLFSGDKW